MAYWRMQLHPADPGNSTRHAVESLTAGFIGLGFRSDLTRLGGPAVEYLPFGYDPSLCYPGVREEHEPGSPGGHSRHGKSHRHSRDGQPGGGCRGG